MTYQECFRTAPLLYNICSAYQRMMDDYGFVLDPELKSSAWVEIPEYIEPYAAVFREYFAVAQQYHVPMIATASNRGGFRHNREKAGQYLDRPLVRENLEFLRKIAAGYDAPIYLGCIESCIGDQYDPNTRINPAEAYDFHRRQTDEWFEAAPDFLYSGIMPEINETVGMARAFSDSKIPYHIGFIITDSGRLLDGTTLHDAICRVDDATGNPALMFMCNCIHPTNLLHALEQPFNRTETVRTRMLGSISNASMLKPSELECCEHIDNASASALVDALIELYDFHPLRLVGGCCGTNQTHMVEMVRRMQAHIAK